MNIYMYIYICIYIYSVCFLDIYHDGRFMKSQWAFFMGCLPHYFISILDFHGEALVNVISEMTLKVHLVNSKVDQGDIST